MSMKAILFGATGMVGEGVLHEALDDPRIDSVLVIGRRSCGLRHPRLVEVLHNDFYDYSAIEVRLAGYDACFFCLGVTSVGKREEEYRRLTYDLTMAAARTLVRLNPQMVFCYVSGAGTDSTERGKSMWARVKGKTENDLMKLPFKAVYNFRPGIMRPTKGLKNTLGAYKYLSWLFPIMELLTPKSICTLKEVGLAMINATTKGYEKQIVEVTDIVTLAKR